jgi:hypothetical protein
MRAQNDGAKILPNHHAVCHRVIDEPDYPDAFGRFR